MNILITVGSIVLGFLAWVLGLSAIVCAGNRKPKRSMSCTTFSFIACLGGVCLQYYDLVRQIAEKTTDTISGSVRVIWFVILVIAGVTAALNLLAGLLRLIRKPKKDQAPAEKPEETAAPGYFTASAPSMADSAAAMLEKTED